MFLQTRHLQSLRKLQAEGKMDKAEGEVQKEVGKGKDAIRDATRC